MIDHSNIWGNQATIGELIYTRVVKIAKSMPKTCTKPLKQQPFQTYRDPETGRWYVVRSSVPTATPVLATSQKK